jgi:hypothetical protein
MRGREAAALVPIILNDRAAHSSLGMCFGSAEAGGARQADKTVHTYLLQKQPLFYPLTGLC